MRLKLLENGSCGVDSAAQFFAVLGSRRSSDSTDTRVAGDRSTWCMRRSQRFRARPSRGYRLQATGGRGQETRGILFSVPFSTSVQEKSCSFSAWRRRGVVPSVLSCRLHAARERLVFRRSRRTHSPPRSADPRAAVEGGSR
ncbi:hypothetical protein TGARI_300300 [Toxoplasma gondii ARI]|uniref:Uncharacterized protein n=1 Tax=Toxoplasma gondii ARI TaxID=1074872 RepID=A0A139XLH4_TOXGO|nr:hypothetical protein TGARI_300300 [Toxoplasma gondii ARI]